MAFRGSHPTTIDTKGRTSVPARLRDELAALGDRVVVTVSDSKTDRFLQIYPLQAWEQFEAKLMAHSPFEPGFKQLMRLLVGNAVDLNVDDHGRINVPQNLRAYAGLEKDVIWSGQGNFIALWDAETWKRDQEEAQSPIHREAVNNAYQRLGGVDVTTAKKESSNE